MPDALDGSDALDSWLRRLEQMQPDKMELGLGRIKDVAQSASLLNPNFRLVTVAGTNGKGSTVAYIAKLLGTLDMSVGVYTSPHFIDFNERIVIDDRKVTDAELCAAFEHIEQSRASVKLTYFEFTTLAAIFCFIQRNVDIAVLEVGLGGRLDAVNVWDSQVACITSIGIDHTDWLGDNRESIGVEKAGVARKDCPLICGDLDPPASIARVAAVTGARLLLAGEHFGARQLDAERFEYFGTSNFAELPMPAIPGTWAMRNAAVAICACEQLLAPRLQQGLPQGLPEAAVKSALLDVQVVGRMQRLEYGSVPVLLDVAHNREAASLLADYLASHSQGRRVTAVFGCMQDKDASAIVDSLRSVIDVWHVAQINYPRAMLAAQIGELVGDSEMCIFASVIQAFDAAVAQLAGEHLVVVFGSFHVVGPVLEQIYEHTPDSTEYDTAKASAGMNTAIDNTAKDNK